MTFDWTFDWTLNEKRRTRPITKLAIVLALLVLLPPSIILHYPKWLIDGDGFLNPGPRGGTYNYRPGTAASFGSMFGMFGLLLISLEVFLLAYAGVILLFLLSMGYAVARMKRYARK